MTLPGTTANRRTVRQFNDATTAKFGRRPIAAALAVAGGLCLSAFPLLRPWGDKTGSAAQMMDAFASTMWVVAHAAGMLGFALIGAAALIAVPRPGRWLAAGVALVLPFFGAETFGLHAVAVHFGVAAGAADAGDAAAAADAGDAAAATEVEALAGLIREGAVQMTMFGLGLLTIAIGGVLLARRNRLAMVLAIALATYLPQFFFGAEVRIAHGLLLLAGALGWAWSLARVDAGSSASTDE